MSYTEKIINASLSWTQFTILCTYELTLGTKKSIKPQRRGLTISPAGGVPLIFSKS
jgi:hypothetical protein